MASIKLPRDAEGQIIPFDTKILYNKNGEELNIQHFEFSTASDEWMIIVALKHGSYNCFTAYYTPQNVYLEKPARPISDDSWEKLENDLERGIKGDRACAYICKDGVCQNCAVREDQSFILKDVKRRIHNLRSKK